MSNYSKALRTIVVLMCVTLGVQAQQYTDIVVTNDENIIVTEYVEKFEENNLKYSATKGYNLHVFDKHNEIVGVYIDLDTPEKYTRFTIHNSDTVAVFMFSPRVLNNWCNDWQVYVFYLESIFPKRIADKLLRLSRTALRNQSKWNEFKFITTKE